MTYFLGLITTALFGGLPLPGTLRIASRASMPYNGDWVIGFIFALESLVLIVPSGISKMAAISATVNPSIFLLIDIIRKYIKFRAILQHFTLTKSFTSATIIRYDKEQLWKTGRFHGRFWPSALPQGDFQRQGAFY